MRKIVTLVVAMVLATSLAFALMDDTDITTSKAKADATAIQGQVSVNKNDNVGINKQIGITEQGQVAVGTVEVSDNSKTKTIAVAFPTQGATEGVASANASYMLGNLGLSDTEVYKKAGYIIQTVLAIPDEIVNPLAKTQIVNGVVDKMLKSVKPRRLVGIGPEQHSKNLLNLFGVLSWDSFWADNQRPFQKKADIGQ